MERHGMVVAASSGLLFTLNDFYAQGATASHALSPMQRARNPTSRTAASSSSA